MNLSQQTSFLHSLGKPVLQGAGIGLALLSFFLFSGDAFATGQWMLIPFCIVALGGAFGGLIYALANRVTLQGRILKLIASVISIGMYLCLLWLSLVAALSVTGHWD